MRLKALVTTQRINYSDADDADDTDYLISRP